MKKQQDQQEQVELYSPELLTEMLPVKKTLVDSLKLGLIELSYVEKDGLAITEGDIILGTVKDIQNQNRKIREQLKKHKKSLTATRVAGISSKLWFGGIVNFSITPDLVDKQRVYSALSYWKALTSLTFIEGNFGVDDNYICFVNGEGCSSSVGMVGGKQNITLGPNCTEGNAIHEIGHALGLWHEQSRADRDRFVIYEKDNVIPGKESNFNIKKLEDGIPLEEYDYSSIMHYGKFAFTKNDKPTLTPTNPNVKTGQRIKPSYLDVKAINDMYRQPVTDLVLITGENTDPPFGYTKIDVDLRRESGGDYIYLCYAKNTWNDQAISDIRVLTKDETLPPDFKEYTKLVVSNGNVAIYYKKTSRKKTNAKIVNLDVLIGQNSYPQNGSSYIRCNVDLNKGHGGNYIYLCYQLDPTVPIKKIATCKYNQAPEGFHQLPMQLPDGTTENRYLCIQKDSNKPSQGYINISKFFSKEDNPAVPEGFDTMIKYKKERAGLTSWIVLKSTSEIRNQKFLYDIYLTDEVQPLKGDFFDPISDIGGKSADAYVYAKKESIVIYY